MDVYKTITTLLPNIDSSNGQDLIKGTFGTVNKDYNMNCNLYY